MKSSLIALVVIILVATSGCHRGDRRSLQTSAPGGPAAQTGRSHDDHHVQSFAMFGSANVTMFEHECAGRITLVDGRALVEDSCFTGDTNVVLCSDMTAPNPLRCTPGKGTLSVTGTGGDTVSYMRAR